MQVPSKVVKCAWCRNPINYKSAFLPFGDSGGHDNIGITPLLRRKIEKIVCGVATETNPDNDATTWAIGKQVSLSFPETCKVKRMQVV